MRQLWARALALGVADDVFWSCTWREVDMLCSAYTDRITQDRKAAAQCASLIATQVINVNKTKGEPLPIDYFVAADVKVLTPKQMESVFDAHFGKRLRMVN